jgi:hypothetical protein
MADNQTVDNGSLSDYTVATDDDGAAHHQYVKLEWGPDNTQTKVSSGAAALPIQDGGNSITVDGTVAVSGTVTVADGGSPISIDDNDSTISIDDGGGSITVDGTVTATASGDHTVVGKAADGAAVSGNPVLVAGQDGTNVQTIKTDTNGELQVDVLTMPTVTVQDGGSTISVDDGAGSLTVDGTVGVSGTVTVDSELTTADLDTGAGTDTRAVVGLVGQASGGGQLIGATANALDVNIKSGGAGDGAILDGVTSSIKATVLDYTNSNPLAVRLTDTAGDYVSAGGGTQYTEDATAASDPTGTQLISRRRDSLASEVSADGDVIAVNSTAKGELYVKHVDAIPVTDNGTTLSVDDNGSTISVDDGGGSLTVDGTVGISGTVTVDSELPAAAALTDNAANPTAPAVGAFGLVWDGATWDRAPGTAADGALVNLGTNNDVTVTGTVTVDSELPAAAALADGAANPTTPTVGSANLLYNGTTWDRVRGDTTNGLDVDVTRLPYDVAHDAADSGNPLKVGFRAVSALPTAVGSADRVNAIADLFGRQMVTFIDPAQQIWKQVEASTAQTGTAIWTPAAGKRIAVCKVVIGTAGTTAGLLTIWFGASGDTTFTQGTDQVVFRGTLTPTANATPGVVMDMTNPMFSTTADYVLRYTTSAALTVYITVYGYEF